MLRWLQKIFEKVDCLHLSTPVTKITSLPHNSPTDSLGKSHKYRIESEGTQMGVFDAVILTCPSVVSGVELVLDFVTVTPKLQEKSGYCRDYQTTHTTFVKGKMNSAYFLKEGGGTISQSLLAKTLKLILGGYYEDPTALPGSIYLVEDGANKVSTTFRKLCNTIRHLAVLLSI